MQVQSVRQVGCTDGLGGHARVEGTADPEVVALARARVDAPRSGFIRKTREGVVQTEPVLIQTVVARREAAELQGVREAVDVHAAAPIGNGHVQIVLILVRGKGDADERLSLRGGDGVIHDLAHRLMEAHSLAAEAFERFARDVDGNLIGAQALGLRHRGVVHVERDFFHSKYLISQCVVPARDSRPDSVLEKLAPLPLALRTAAMV